MREQLRQPTKSRQVTKGDRVRPRLERGGDTGVRRRLLDCAAGRKYSVTGHRIPDGARNMPKKGGGAEESVIGWISDYSRGGRTQFGRFLDRPKQRMGVEQNLHGR